MPIFKITKELCLVYPQRYAGRGSPKKALRDAGFTTCMFYQLKPIQHRTKLKLVREAKARINYLNKKEDAELLAEASRATTPQNLCDQQTPSTKILKHLHKQRPQLQ